MAKSEHTVTLMTTPIGRYEWWPELQLVDFVFKGKIRGMVVGHTKTTNNLEEALAVAAKHLHNTMRRK